ncbi:hypothetical protein GR212_21890 [Rhizobium lusitanum]|uniref:Uncharacterized protein n=1 Tax=Rhizobium lusitanum TaxID=293958 RepID=A0A6L9UDR5_9HYPH|nr:MarR family transcriptional regulator [Rhizobium lusitanum]NEI72240.1 hypothetical protein [Rhizobium lusitanum]
MSKESAGIAAFARIFSRIADGNVENVASLVESEGIVRSTAFDVVKRMEAAGLVSRQPNGHLLPGNAAGEFAYAGMRVGPLFGPAQTLLPWLRERTNASIALLASDGAKFTMLLNYAARWDHGKPRKPPIMISLKYQCAEVALLRVTPHPDTGAEDLGRCEELAATTARELENFLRA